MSCTAALLLTTPGVVALADEMQEEGCHCRDTKSQLVPQGCLICVVIGSSHHNNLSYAYCFIFDGPYRVLFIKL